MKKTINRQQGSWDILCVTAYTKSYFKLVSCNCFRQIRRVSGDWIGFGGSSGLPLYVPSSPISHVLGPGRVKCEHMHKFLILHDWPDCIKSILTRWPYLEVSPCPWLEKTGPPFLYQTQSYHWISRSVVFSSSWKVYTLPNQVEKQRGRFQLSAIKAGPYLELDSVIFFIYCFFLEVLNLDPFRACLNNFIRKVM